MSLLRATSFCLALALGACAHEQAPAPVAPPPPQAQVASAPSPRAECAPAHVTLYFSERVASDEPVVTPLLNDFMDRIRACETAGGELRSVIVAVSADPGQSAGDAAAQIQRRYGRVRAALVELGVPEGKIGGAVGAAGGLMGRRAEITANLY